MGRRRGVTYLRCSSSWYHHCMLDTMSLLMDQFLSSTFLRMISWIPHGCVLWVLTRLTYRYFLISFLACLSLFMRTGPRYPPAPRSRRTAHTFDDTRKKAQGGATVVIPSFATMSFLLGQFCVKNIPAYDFAKSTWLCIVVFDTSGVVFSVIFCVYACM